MRVNVLSSIQSRFSKQSKSRWSNPDARDTVDELDWERTAATDGGRFPLTDHTTGTEGGFFMQVLDSLQPSFIRLKMMRRFPGRTSAAQATVPSSSPARWTARPGRDDTILFSSLAHHPTRLKSDVYCRTYRPRCMSFWFFMYEPIVDTTGRVGEVVLQSCDTNSKRYYFHKEIKMKNRAQSGKVGRVDKNNQPTRPAGD